MTPTAPRLTAASSVLIVVDIQDKLLAKIPTAASLVRNTAFLLDAAALCGVPVICTEQYPKGLGPTTEELARRIPGGRPAKTAFSCCGAAGFLDSLRTLARAHVILAGMETHVCVMQTALDVLQAGFSVVLPVDALAARGSIDHETAIRRLEHAGAILTTVEAVGFEWIGDSAHQHFKTFSQLVIQRSQPQDSP